MNGLPNASDDTPAGQSKQGLILLNCGRGKGKTTAALGLLLRAWGWDMKVVMFQFIKNARLNCGEHRAAKRLGIEVIAGGHGRTPGQGGPARNQESARELWVAARDRIKSGQYDVVILDELTYPLTYGWLSLEEIVEALNSRPAHVSVVITGRNPPDALIDIADTVTEMNEIKHAYRRGIKAQRGIEF